MDVALLEQRLQAFQPAPLISTHNNCNDIEQNGPIEIHAIKDHAPEGLIRGTFDMSKVNYFNILDDLGIKQCAERTIRQYGVGTCGPRAFYGTTEPHLVLEEKLARFLRMDQVIIYSFGFVAISSTIGAYCKRSDLVFTDEFANPAILYGLEAVHCTVQRYRHNDHVHFEELLEVEKGAESIPSKNQKRKFLILEAINWRRGTLCHLPQFVEVAERHKVRVFLDESYSLGVYGREGRGLTEHFNVAPTRLDMIIGTLEGAIGSIGGFSAGSAHLIEHQCLSSSGYIFSASLPTFLAQIVIESLDICQRRVGEFQVATKQFHQFLRDELQLHVISDEGAPFKVIEFTDDVTRARFTRDCHTCHVHFIERPPLHVVMHMNLALLQNTQKLCTLKEVLKKASCVKMVKK